MTRAAVLIIAGCAALVLPPGSATQDKQDIQRLKDKIELIEARMELLKKEIELLKKDNELLRKDLELAKKEGGAKSGDAKDTAKKGLPKATYEGVEYQVVSSKRNGDKWQLILDATSPVDKRVIFPAARAVSEDGKTYDLKTGMQGMVLLPAGVKIKLEMNLSALPKTIKSVTRLEFYAQAFGKNVTFVLENIPIDQ
jgi:hypothetical protein